MSEIISQEVLEKKDKEDIISNLKEQLKELKNNCLNEKHMRTDLEEWLMTNHLDVWDEYIEGLESKYGGK